MPVHDRWRSFAPFLLLSIFALLLSTTSAAVLGIDLGTEYIKAALVKPGIHLEIVLTKDSKRKEAAAIAFKPLRSKSSTSSSDTFPERLYGGDALAVSARFPGDVYSNLKPLLGLTVAGNNAVTDFGSRYPGLNIVDCKDRGTVSFRSEAFEEKEEPFTVEELLGMELQNIRANAEAFAGKGSNVRDVVISIPVFFTVEEKRAVEVAAELAGLRLLALTSDGLSVGVNYAKSRTFPVVKEGVKPEYHLIYDMGAGSTTATVLRFQGKNVKDVGKFNKTIQEVQVVGVGWDKTMGGDAFNALILEDMITKFAAIPRMKALGTSSTHIRQDGRTMAKLWKEAERMRQVLSANTETSSSFEGLFSEDINFKYKLSRAEFEEFAAPYTERVYSPITQALSAAKLDLNDIESVILHGGAVRTPFVQKELESAAGSSEKVRTNVNSDEAAVLGAAFKAAGISPSFRGKEIRAIDSVGYAAGVSWLWDGKQKQQKLFQPTSHIGTEKQVPFKNIDDFTFELYQQVSVEGGETRDISVSKVQTQNLTTSIRELTEKFGCSTTDISTSFSIRLSSLDGIPEVTRGFVSCEVVDTKRGDFVDNVKGLFGFGSGTKKGDQDPLLNGLDEEITSDAGTHTSTLSSSVTTEPKQTDTRSSDKSKEKRKIETIHIGFTVNATGLPQFSASEMQRMKDRMASLDASDRSRKFREEALNTLEGYTYKVRDLVEDEGFVAASTEKQRSQIEEKCKSASEWLYGDGADASREELKSRLQELRDLVDPISKRKEEALKRPGDIKMLKESLEQTKGLIKMVREQSEKATQAAAAVSASSLLSAAETRSTPEAASVVDDDFAGLDDEPTSTSTASSSTTNIPEAPLYSTEDLADMSRTHESIQNWLDEKLAEQQKLSPFDDPVILSSDLAAKSKELNKVVMDVLQKKMHIPPKVKNTSKLKTGKTKSTKSTTTSSSSSSPASTSSISSTSESGAPAETEVPTGEDRVEADVKGNIKDEL